MRPLMRLAKWGFAVLCVGALLAVAILVFLPDEKYRQVTESALTSALGRATSIQAMSVEFGSRIEISASGIKVANASWAESPHMLDLQQLSVEIRLLSLLAGELQGSARVNGAIVDIEKDSTGANNWSLGSATAEEDDSSPQVISPIPDLEILEIVNSTVQFSKSGGLENQIDISQLLIEKQDSQSQIALTGMLNFASVAATGSLGNLQHVLQQGTDILDISGSLAGNSFSILGYWGPVLPKFNASIGVSMDVDSPQDLAALLGLEIDDVGDISIDATVEARDGEWSIGSLISNIDGQDISGEIDGSISDLDSLQGMDLRTRVQTSTLNRLLDSMGIALPFDLPPNAAVDTRISGSLRNVSNFSASIHDEGLTLDISGAVSDVFGLAGLEAKFDLETTSTEKLSGFLGREIPDLGHATIKGEIIRKEEASELQGFIADIGSGPVKLTARGAVSDVQDMEGIDVHVELTGKNVPPPLFDQILGLAASYGWEAPISASPDDLTIKFHVTGDQDRLSLGAFNLNASHKSAEFSASGDIQTLVPVDGGSIRVKLEAGNLADLSDIMPQTFPAMGKVSLNGRISPVSGVFSGNDIDARVVNDTINFRARGEIGNLLELSGISSEISAEIEATSDAQAQHIVDRLAEVGLSLHPRQIPSSSSISGKVAGDREKLDIQDLEAEVTAPGLEARITGTVDDLFSSEDLDLELSASISSAEYLEALLNRSLSGMPPLTLDANLDTRETDEEGTHEFNATVTGEDLEFTASGGLQDILDPDYLDLTVSAQSDLLSQFNFLTEKPLPEIGPLKLRGTFRTTPGTYAMPEFTTTLGKQQVFGNFEVSEPTDDSGNYVARGLFNILYLDLTPYFESALGNGTSRISSETESGGELYTSDETGDKVFSTKPIPLDLLRQIDAEFSIQAQRLKFRKTDMDNVSITVKLQKGELDVEPVSASAGDGSLTGDIHLDASSAVPEFSFDLSLNQFPMPNTGGKVDMNLDLDGHGNSVADIMAGLNGNAILVIRDGIVEKSFVSNFGSGLFSFSTTENQTGLECGIVRVDVKDGLADFENQMAAQFTGVTWIGGGTVNLENEEIRIRIAPRGRRGVPTGSNLLARMVGIGGTLSHPRMVVNPTDVALNYGRYLAFFSTGGLSLLAEGLFDLFRANRDVCRIILKGSALDFNNDPESAPE